MYTGNHFRNQKVLVAGFGRFGACLSAALSKAGYAVVVIDKQKSAFRRLPDSLQGFVIKEDAVMCMCWSPVRLEILVVLLAAARLGKDIRSCVRRRKTT